MKTAIYIVEGTVQIVLTSENDHELSAINLINNAGVKLSTFLGSFYECKGGWYREGTDDKSLIVRLDKLTSPETTIKEDAK